MALTLYSFPGDFRAMKALVCAQYNGVAIARPAFKLGVDNVTDSFKAKSPAGKVCPRPRVVGVVAVPSVPCIALTGVRQVPLLETPAGCIFESSAIARYVARLRRDTQVRACACALRSRES